MKPGLPICQHIAIGAALQDIRDVLMNVTSDIYAAYPKSSQAARQGQAVLDQLDRLRTELDNVSASENPGGNDWAPNIYYGQDRGRRDPIVAAILAQHQASRPSCCC